jgi:hypothetical protein
MGLRADIRDEVRKETATKIHGQPTDHDVTLLEKELIAIAATIPSTLGGGNHGHAGLIVEPAKYLTMTGGTAFIQPGNPGIYPAGLAPNAAAGTRAREEAEHKELIAQYEIHKGVEQALKDIIIQAVDEDYLLEIEDETLGFLNETPRSMIIHLRNRGGALDFADTKTLLTERDQEWDASEIPTIYFNRVEKAMQQLTRAGITSDLKERTDMALYYLKSTGEYDAAVREWETKPVATRTWANIKIFMSAEYAKENKQNKQTAKQMKANAIEEQAEATEELIANLTEAHTRQIELLIKANTEAMKEMMSLVKDKTITPTNPTNQTSEEKKKKREEKQKKFLNAPVCKHCGKKHPSKKEDECWELDKNAASRPASWKPTKST